jgi:predicted RNA binding protein YcfA (HicA-like mRNA interferase family)
MSHLPRLSGRERISTEQKAGFVVIRQQGSHVYLKKCDPFIQLVVPDHRERDTGTVSVISRQSGLSIVEFLALV